mmetsp:Transcript_5673/g.11905  ORF Transcript_5673/g.11905 Transcript_5673/m.11905 type:complete len:122 (+) Transcript_5673:2217-2582(+)
MCEYIRAENIKTLLSYIVNKYMTAESSLLLEAIPYVDTFTLLRQQYEDNQAKSEVGSDDGMSSSNGTGSGYFPDEDAAAVRRLSVMGVKVIEDQVNLIFFSFSPTFLYRLQSPRNSCDLFL